MLGAIKYALLNLANFTGRDARQTFWYYVLFIVILRFAAGLFVSVPMTVSIMGRVMAAVRSGADPVAAKAVVFEVVTEMMSKLMWLGIVVGVVTMILLAASLVRRLHDSDMSGWWVLLPGGLYVAALALMPAMIHRVIEILSRADRGIRPNPIAIMQGQGAYSLLSWIPLALVIWFGVRKSSEGPNRFGDTSVQF